MIDLVASVSQLSAQQALPAESLQAKTADFDKALFSAIDGVGKMHNDSDNALQLLASGEHVDLHGTMIALERADIALRTMVSVRDKVVGAYEQIMNMAI